MSQSVIRTIVTWSLLGLGASLLLSLAHAAEPEQVPIQKLLSPQVTSYQQHLVTLEGVTSQLQVLPPSIGAKNCSAIYGRASFVLEDETGSMPIDVLGACTPRAVEALPKDGNRIRITGLVHALKSEAPRNVRVQATVIQILESH